MTANQRRPGFRLPWSSELGDAEAGAPEAGAAEADVADAGSADAGSPSAPSTNGTGAATEPTPVASAAEPAVPPAEPGASPDFMRELVAAMRNVADEARESGVSDARSRADAQVATVEAAAEARRSEIQARAEQDIAAVGEWAQVEAARIRREAEEKVATRRRQLEEQLAADAARTRDESDSVRRRAAAYEQELEAYHAQLIEIEDPAVFAAAAKRMPQPPVFEASATAAPTTDAAPAARPETVSAPEPTAAEGATAPTEAAPAVGVVHPAEERVLAQPSAHEAASAAEPASAPPARPADEPAAAATTRAEPITTDIVVKGLGSFGAITGFRQTLAGADGIDGVALSLGQTGEFVFRATHQPGLDIAGVIRALEGEGAKVDTQGERSFLVSLDRAR